MLNPDMDIELLPRSLRDIVDTIGLPATIALVKCYGGIRCSVPRTMTRDHVLAKRIGHEPACKLTERYGGETLELPLAVRALLALRDAEIIRRSNAGESANALAREFNTDRKSVV